MTSITPSVTMLRPLIALLLSLLLNFASFAIAVEVKEPLAAIPNVNASLVVVGIIALATGILLCFFGKAMWRVTIFLASLYVFASFGLMVLLNIEASGTSFGENRDWIILGATAAIGIAGGFLGICLYKLGVFLIGAAGGYFLAMWILVLAAGFNGGGLGRVVFIIVLMLIVGLLALKFEKAVVILATAIAGACLLVYSFDCFANYFAIDGFANTGFQRAVESVLNGQTVNIDQLFTNKKPGIVYAVLAVIFAILGAIAQFKRRS